MTRRAASAYFSRARWMSRSIWGPAIDSWISKWPMDRLMPSKSLAKWISPGNAVDGKVYLDEAFWVSGH